MTVFFRTKFFPFYLKSLIGRLYVVVLISSIYFAFMSTNMSTFTQTWSEELLRLGKFIPVRLFEVHQMNKERSST